jgi:hypothetical protein
VEDAGEDTIQLPRHMCCDGDTEEGLIHRIYGRLADFESDAQRDAYITERIILTALNTDATKISNTVNDAYDLRSPPCRKTSYSADSVLTDHGNYGADTPVEFLNQQEFSGMPAHALHLQVGCPIILQRTLIQVPRTDLQDGGRLPAAPGLLPRPALRCGIAQRITRRGRRTVGTVFLVPGSGGNVNGAPMYTRNIVYREVLLD